MTPFEMVEPYNEPMSVFSVIKNIKDAIQGKAKLGQRRSPQWPKVRAEHLKRSPTCIVCGGKKKLEVHHIVPFHLDTAKELDVNNLITLCESKKNGVNCHLFVGHLGNFQSLNTDVTKDATEWRKKIVLRKGVPHNE